MPFDATDTLSIFADAVIVAEAAAADVAAEVAAAADRRAAIDARLAAFASDRRAIVARRATGDHHADDGPRLALIAADAEGLTGLLGDADAALATARTKQTQSAREVVRARAGFESEKARLAVDSLDAHAARLVDLLAETLTQRQAAALALAPDDRAVAMAAVIGRLGVFESTMLSEIQAMRLAVQGSALHFAQRPIWHPAESFRNELHKLHYSEGRF